MYVRTRGTAWEQQSNSTSTQSAVIVGVCLVESWTGGAAGGGVVVGLGIAGVSPVPDDEGAAGDGG